jgi:hypothetical protein
MSPNSVSPFFTRSVGAARPWRNHNCGLAPTRSSIDSLLAGLNGDGPFPSPYRPIGQQQQQGLLQQQQLFAWGPDGPIP